MAAVHSRQISCKRHCTRTILLVLLSRSSAITLPLSMNNEGSEIWQNVEGQSIICRKLP